MKVRLTQPGFENYTGQMGVIFFQNGVSTSDVSTMDATRMGAVMKCEWFESDETISPAQAILDAQENKAPVMKDHLGEGADPVVAGTDKPQTLPVEEVLPPEAPADAKKMTQAELEAIADKDGIAGIRAIAEPLGIKGRGIAELIQDLIKAGYAEPTPAE